MVVFLDTSGLYALTNEADANHASAVRGLSRALESADTLLLHNYIIVESAALLRRRLGWDATARLLSVTDRFAVRWVDEPLHRAAVTRFMKRRGRASLVDEVSFLVMQEAGARHALAFDRDFFREGFLPYPST